MEPVTLVGESISAIAKACSTLVALKRSAGVLPATQQIVQGAAWPSSFASTMWAANKWRRE